MKSLYKIVVLMALFLPAGFMYAQETRQWIGVIPFSNSVPDPESDYLGFQVAEYFSSVLIDFPNVQTISRLSILDGLRAWELQLSGPADLETGDAYDLGKLLDLNRLIVGSFELSPDGLFLHARLVDVATRTAISDAVVKAPPADSYVDSYRLLLSILVSGLPEYESSMGADARIKSHTDAWGESPIEYSKALAASWAKDDQAALGYLEKALSSARLPFPGYIDAAELMRQLLDQAEDPATQAPSMRNKLATNQALVEHLEAIAIYRNNLQMLMERIKAGTKASSFVVSGNPTGDLLIEASNSSTKIILPETVGLELKPKDRVAFETAFSLHDATINEGQGLRLPDPPVGTLLNPSVLRDGFNLSVRVLASHSVQFLDTSGSLLYELISEPSPVVSLGRNVAQLSATPPAIYRPTRARNGWLYHSDGTLEVDPKAFASMRTVRYQVDPAGFRLETAFLLDNDLYWRSLTAHAYRKFSNRIAALGEEPVPPIKEVLVTDSFYPGDDPDLGRVPILPRNKRVAGYSHLTGIVYVAEATPGFISASWSGSVSGTNEPLRGKSAPNGVLYFDAPESNTPRYGSTEFTATLSTSGYTASYSTFLGNGGGWTSEARPNEIVIAGKLIISDTGTAFSIAGGKAVWDSKRKGYPILQDDGSIMLVGGDATYNLNKDNGTLISQWPYSSKGRIFHAEIQDGILCVLSEFGGLEGLDIKTGKRLWNARVTGERTFLLQAGRVYAGNGSVYNAQTGKRLFTTDGRGVAAPSIDVIIWENGVCTERFTGKRLWRQTKLLGTPTLFNDTVIFGGHTAIGIADGKVIWKEGIGGDNGFLSDGVLYSWYAGRLYAIDPATGKGLWSCFSDRRATRIAGGYLYDSFEEGGLVRFDLSLLRRELSTVELAERGRIDAQLEEVEKAGSRRAGVFVSNLIRTRQDDLAGLLPGDYLVAFDGIPVFSRDQVLDLAFERRKAEIVTLRIARQDARSSAWSESALTLGLSGVSDRLEPQSYTPGFSLGTISAARLRELKLDRLARFDSFIVDSVYSGSPAALAGLAAGDIIVQVDAIILDASFLGENAKRLFTAIANAVRNKGPVTLSVIRDGTKKMLPPFRP